jgi:hypothetical protein
MPLCVALSRRPSVNPDHYARGLTRFENSHLLNRAMTQIRAIALITLGVFSLFGLRAFAQRPESPTSQLFPTTDRVFADYKDDAERWAACEALLTASMQKLPDGQYKASYQKSSSYQQTMGSIQFKYEQMGKDAPAAKEFFARIEKLRADTAFRQKVMGRYGLGALPTATAKDLQPRIQKSGEQLTREAAPYWLATLVAMWLVTRFLVRTAGNRFVDPGGGGGLPESLRVINVLGRRYAVGTDSGVVVEETTWSDTTTSTIQTPGSVQTFGDTTYVTVPQQQTVTSTVRKDRIWVRDAAGREKAWNFSNAGLDVRVGHVLSYVGRQTGEDITFLMAYNHTTGQFVNLPMGLPHYAPFFRASIAAALVGTAGFVYGGWEMIPMIRPEEIFFWNLIAFAVVGLIFSTIWGWLGAFFQGGRVIRKRNALYERNYVPRFREWFQQNTPALMSRFAAHR